MHAISYSIGGGAGLISQDALGNVLRAATGGALCGSVIFGLYFYFYTITHPTGGPLNFDSPLFALILTAIAFAAGWTASFLCLLAIVAAAGEERLSNWNIGLAALTGLACGALFICLFAGLFFQQWPGLDWLAIGAAYGIPVGALWAYFSRRAPRAQESHGANNG